MRDTPGMTNTLSFSAREESPGWVPQMDLADRLRKTLRETGIGVSEMALRIGVTRETVGTWINGRITPKGPSLLAWATITGCDLSWLETGLTPEDTSDVRPLNELPRLDSNQQPSGYLSAQVTDLGAYRLARAS